MLSYDGNDSFWYVIFLSELVPRQIDCHSNKFTGCIYLGILKKPAVGRNWLLLLSGFMWSGVGILLNSFAIRWLQLYEGWPLAVSVACGIVLGLAIAFFGFRRVAATNIQRILTMPENSCVFAFQKWQSYILIAVMMSMGIFLRHTAIFPRIFLASVYMGIGSALFIASIKYYRTRG